LRKASAEYGEARCTLRRFTTRLQLRNTNRNPRAAGQKNETRPSTVGEGGGGWGGAAGGWRSFVRGWEASREQSEALTFDQRQELLVLHLAALHVDLERQQQREQELVLLVQPPRRVAVHLEGHDLDDADDALAGNGALGGPGRVGG